MPKRRRAPLIAAFGLAVIAFGTVSVPASDPPSAEKPDREATAVVAPEPAPDGSVPDGEADSAPSPEPDPDPVTAAAAAAPLRLEFGTPSLVNHVRVATPGVSAGTAQSAILEFSDGSELLITVDSTGLLDTTFPERRVTGVSLTPIAPADGAVEGFAVDYVQSPATGARVASSVEPWTSSNGSDRGGLTDGDAASGDVGNEWAPNPTDRHPMVSLTWPAPQEIASVQILGPSSTAFDPAYSAAASLWGELLFDDGSSVIVSGIEGGDDQPTTVAFTPRMTSSVRLQLHPTIDQANPGLREFAAYVRGETPPRWPAMTAGVSAVPVAASCASSSAPVGSSASGLALVCPAVGSSLSGPTQVIVAGAAGRAIQLVSQDASKADRVIGLATATSTGRAAFTVDPSALPFGPIGLRVRYVDAPTVGDFTLQVFNAVGAKAPAPATAPPGMTLQWSEEFVTPVSVTQLGGDSTYAATKPAYWGESEFGSAIFADPAAGAGTIATIGGEYLRIRAQPRGQYVDPKNWGREHVSGILSSLKVGATGFSAQYGYFEARMLAPGGTGTWPAFWMLNTESAANRTKTESAEVDAVELYGHDTTASCHSLHNWVNGDDREQINCKWPNGFSDWSMTWHTYGVRISPDKVDYYIDGVPVQSSAGLSLSGQPFYWMVNLSLGGGYAIQLEQVGGTADLYVDYIRVYT
jgi:hypothetical protein